MPETIDDLTTPKPKREKNIITTKELHQTDVQWENWWKEYQDTGVTPVAPDDQKMLPYYEQFVVNVKTFEESPEGLQYKQQKTDLEVLTPFKTAEGFYNVNQAREAGIDEALLTRMFGQTQQGMIDVTAPTTDEQGREYRRFDTAEGEMMVAVDKELEASLHEAFPEMFKPTTFDEQGKVIEYGTSYGLTIEELFPHALQNLMESANRDFGAFHKDLIDRVGDEKALEIMQAMGVNETVVLGNLEAMEQEERVVNTIQNVFPQFSTIEDFSEFVKADEGVQFIKDIQLYTPSGASNSQRRQLLETMDFSPEDINGILNQRTMFMSVDGIRQEVTVDISNQNAYDRNGDYIGEYNWATQEFSKTPDKNVLENFWDWTMFTARTQWENTENFFLSVLPNIIYPEMPEGYLGGLGEHMDQTNTMMRERFGYTYRANKKDYDDWVKDHPDIVPSIKYQDGAFQNPDLLKDVNYYAYELANLVPFLVTSVGVTLATGGVGALSVLGIAAMQTPSEAQSVYEDLLAAGAPEGKAADMAIVAGSLIGLLESAGRIPLLKGVSSGVFSLFKKKAVGNLITMTVPQLIAQFGKNFTINQFSEAITEVAQEAISNAAVSVYDENRSVFDNLPDIFVKTVVGNMIPSLLGAGGSSSVHMVAAHRAANMTDAQKKAAGWVQDQKGNWYELAEKAKDTSPTAPTVAPAPLAVEVREATAAEAEVPTEIVIKEVTETELAKPIEGVSIRDYVNNLPDVNDAGRMVEWYDIGDKRVYIEGWCDDCLSGTGFPLLEEGGTEEKLDYIKDISGQRLPSKARELDLALIDSGFVELEDAANLYGVTYGIFSKKETTMQPSTSVQTGLPGMGVEAAQAELFREVSGKESQRVPLTEAPTRSIVPEGQIPMEAEEVAATAEEDQIETYQKMEEIETLKYFLETDPVATYKISETVTRKQKQPDGTTKLAQFTRRFGLDRFISIREGTFPSYFTVKEARMLRPNHSWAYYTQKGTPQYNHIPRNNVLDTIAQQLGFDYTGGIDEMVGKIEDIRQSRRTIAELQSDIASVPITPAEAQQSEVESREDPELAPSTPIPPTTPPSNNIPLDTNPEPIMPDPVESNIIGLRPITQGLIKSEIAGNWLKRIVNTIGVWSGIGQLVEADPIANAAMRERARVMVTIESQANALGAKWASDLTKLFAINDQGGIEALAGIDPDLPGAPTLQDIAARLPRFIDSLSDAQLRAMIELREALAPYRQLLEEQGIEVPYRQDVMEGGYYIPRGNAALEGEQPFKVSGQGRGVRRGFERPAYFGSMAEGIAEGFEYRDIGTVLTSFAFDAGSRATNTYIANYFKTLNDENGRLIGETAKMRMLRQNPVIARQVAELNKELNRLKRNIKALTQRQRDVIEMWQNDHEFGDIDVLLDGLEEMRGGRERITLPELQAMYDLAVATIKSLRPAYKMAMRQAQATPRDQGIITLPELAGRTYPNEIANAVNSILKKEGTTIGRFSPVLNVVNVYNNLYRGIRATLDDSVVGIQGLLGMYGDPKAYAGAFKLHILSFAQENVIGAWIKDFDASRKAAGRLTLLEMSKYGLHFAGKEGTEFSLGMGNKIGEMWGVKQANRAFANFGDVIRTLWADHEIETQIRKGRSLDQLRLSGDLDRIMNVANAMTGWSTKKAFGSLGDLVLFAPRFLQARLEVVTKAAMGLRPGATLDQQIARNSIIKMIAIGTLLTVSANMMQGEETDFRFLIQDKNGKWRKNSRFMRIKLGGYYYSAFGTWDSLLGLFLNLGTGRLDLALRSMSSGVVSNAWDLITGRDYNYNAITENPAAFGQWIVSNFIPFGISQAGIGFKQMWGGMVDGEMSDVLYGGINVSAELFGVKSYPMEDWDTTFDKEGLFMYEDDTKLSVEIPRHTWADSIRTVSANSDFRRYNLEDIIASSEYPAKVKAVAHTLLLQDKYQAIKNWTLVSIDEGKYKEYYSQWSARQKLVDAGKKARYTVVGEMQPDGSTKDVTYKGEDAVKAFDKQNKDAKFGNMTQAQYVLLTEYWALNSDELKEEYAALHPELIANERYQTLRSNPEENAYLAMAGYEDILTKEAYNELHRLMRELDIPELAIEPLTLPPKTSIDTHFKYEEMVANGTYNTPEAKLLLLDDFLKAKDNEVVSYCDWRTEAGERLIVPDKELEYYQLQVDNKALFDRLDEIRDDDTLTDKQKEEARAKVRATAVGEQTFADIERRVTVIGKGSRKAPVDPKMVTQYIEHMRLVDTTSGSSAEARLNRYDNKQLNDFLMDENIWGKAASAPLNVDTDYLDNYLVPRWRIDLEFKAEDEAYNAIKDPNAVRQAELRAAYLSGEGLEGAELQRRMEYRVAQRKREGLSISNSITGVRLPVDMLDTYVSYYELPSKGFKRERFIIANPQFAQKMFDITGKDIWKTLPEIVPDIRYDEIYEEWQDSYDQLDAFKDADSPDYKDNTIKDKNGQTERDRAVAEMLFTITDQTYSGVTAKNKQATSFALAIYERDAYRLFIDKKYVNTYVAWRKLKAEGIPDNWAILSGQSDKKTGSYLWFEDDWFMMENIDFYNNVYLADLDKDGHPDHERMDFTKVPSRAIFQKYLIYVDLPHQKAKDDYRLANLDLDKWGVSRFDWTSVTEKVRRTDLTPYERLMEDYYDRQQSIQEKLNDLLNR